MTVLMSLLWLLVSIILGLLLFVFVFYQLLRINYPKVLPLTGSLQYLGISTHRLPSEGGARFKLYYPSSKKLIEKSGSQKCNFFQDSYLFHGLAKFTKLPYFLFHYLIASGQKGLAYMNAPINKEHGEYPLIIFSHGLSGTWDLYDQLCANIASFGFIVAVIEHCDGSAAAWQTSDGEYHLYTPPYPKSLKHVKKYSREQVLEYRTPQLKQRIDTFKTIFHYLASQSDNDYSYNSMTDSQNIEKLLPLIDTNHVFAVGHSYGGATALLSARSLSSEKHNIKGVVTHDIWSEVISDKYISEDWNLPTLFLIGDDWINNEQHPLARVIVDKNRSTEKWFEYIAGITHSDWCDAVMFSPRWLRVSVAGEKRPLKALTMQQIMDRIAVRTVFFCVTICLSDMHLPAKLLKEIKSGHHNYNNCLEWPSDGLTASELKKRKSKTT